jgi:hypothetical protein
MPTTHGTPGRASEDGTAWAGGVTTSLSSLVWSSVL